MSRAGRLLIMVDVWAPWDARVKSSGQPQRVAEDLTNAELLNLLASDEPDRARDKHFLKREANRRLAAADPARPRPRRRARSDSAAAQAPHGTFAEPSREMASADAFSRHPREGPRLDPF